jgi:hypothetical protein
MSGAGEILEGAYGAAIVNGMHECALLGVPGALVSRETDTQDHRR